MKKNVVILLCLTLTAAAVGIGGVFFYKWRQNPHRIAVAKGERTIAKHLAEPLDMTKVVQTPASRFKLIKQVPAWQFVPIGFQTYRNVPLQIDGQICLYGEGNARNGTKFAESLTGIPINQKFETLYVYHGAFYVSPRGTPVYKIVFRYEDGSSATNQILYGDDVLDWYANRGNVVTGPTSERSRLAWHGGAGPGEGKQPLRFCLTAVENPFPAAKVTAMDLYSCKSQSAACILAFTPGRAGLMQ
jgi:hypothetical protein